MFHEGNRFFVPARSEPVNFFLCAIVADGLVVFLVEFNFVTVVDVGHFSPGGVAFDVPLIFGHAQLRGPLLEFHGIATCEHRSINKPEGIFEVTVVIDACFSGMDNRGMAFLSNTQAISLESFKDHPKTVLLFPLLVYPPLVTRFPRQVS